MNNFIDKNLIRKEFFSEELDNGIKIFTIFKTFFKNYSYEERFDIWETILIKNNNLINQYESYSYEDMVKLHEEIKNNFNLENIKNKILELMNNENLFIKEYGSYPIEVNIKELKKNLCPDLTKCFGISDIENSFLRIVENYLIMKLLRMQLMNFVKLYH